MNTTLIAIAGLVLAIVALGMALRAACNEQPQSNRDFREELAYSYRKGYRDGFIRCAAIFKVDLSNPVFVDVPIPEDDLDYKYARLLLQIFSYRSKDFRHI